MNYLTVNFRRALLHENTREGLKLSLSFSFLRDFIPACADTLVMVDKDSGAMTGYTNWPNGFSKSTWYFVGGVFDGTSVWLMPYSSSRLVKVASN